MSNTSKKKRNKIDICNICREEKLLSWDHVPPKGGIILSSVEINNLYGYFEINKPTSKISQNGVKYRTICSVCNSKVGSEFDPTLNDLNKRIIQILQPDKPTLVKNPIKLKTKPIRLMKAVLEHILSAKLNIDNTLPDKKIRESLFKTNEIPSDINIYYWFYPYDITIILRDIALPVKTGDFSKCTFASLIKYFPLAFIITDSQEFRGLKNLTQYRDLGIDDEVEIEIYIDKFKVSDWPERVDENNILFLTTESENGILAKRR